METRYQKHPKLRGPLSSTRARASRVSSEYRTVKLPFPSLLDLLDFTTDQGDRTKTKRDGRKKKGKGKRRRQKAKRSAEPISEAAESLGPSHSSSALAALFSFDACKVFLAGILPRDPAGAPTPGLARNSPVSYLRRFVAPSSASLLLRILGCISSPPLIPHLLSMPFSHGYIPLFVRRRRR